MRRSVASSRSRGVQAASSAVAAAAIATRWKHGRILLPAVQVLGMPAGVFLLPTAASLPLLSDAIVLPHQCMADGFAVSQSQQMHAIILFWHFMQA